MTQLKIFAGMDDRGRPTFRYEHPFLVIGGRPKSTTKLTQLVEVDGRLRHVRVAHPSYRPQVEFSRKTGLPRTVMVDRSIRPRNPDTSRQVRRAMERDAARFSLIPLED